jgi:hypothetical protein
MRNLHLKNTISMEKNQSKIRKYKTDLEIVNNAVYQLLDSTLPTEDENPTSNIFYKSFYKKVKEIGYFDKIATYFGEICPNSEAENSEKLFREFYEKDFTFKDDKDDGKTLLKLWSDTLEEQSDETRELFLYQQRLITERRFEDKVGCISREYERQRFKHKADHDKIILDGICKKCFKKSVVVYSYMDYRRRSSDLESDDLITFDCQKCGSKESCVIPSF